jgi:hypothetical protein
MVNPHGMTFQTACLAGAQVQARWKEGGTPFTPESADFVAEVRFVLTDPESAKQYPSPRELRDVRCAGHSRPRASGRGWPGSGGEDRWLGWWEGGRRREG